MKDMFMIAGFLALILGLIVGMADIYGDFMFYIIAGFMFILGFIEKMIDKYCSQSNDKESKK